MKCEFTIIWQRIVILILIKISPSRSYPQMLLLWRYQQYSQALNLAGTSTSRLTQCQQNSHKKIYNIDTICGWKQQVIHSKVRNLNTMSTGHPIQACPSYRIAIFMGIIIYKYSDMQTNAHDSPPQCNKQISKDLKYRMVSMSWLINSEYTHGSIS